MNTITAYLVLLALLGTAKFTFSQSNIQIGIEMGPKWDISDIVEGDKYIHTNFRLNSLRGINAGFEFRNQFITLFFKTFHFFFKVFCKTSNVIVANSFFE